MPHFLERVDTALADEELKVALGRATERLGSRRHLALASLEHSDQIRDQARHGKMRVLRNLAENLQIFEKNLQRNGVKVHWAENGKAANTLVVEIAKAGQCKRVVKSKSMVTEEIHLNHDLIEAGLDVLETDLGEYIVQLAESTPSHIILPIIHLTKESIGSILHEKIKIPYSNDPEVLCAKVRETMRDLFLSADMGVTGGNFGVVDTGSICLVSNEGNARMVTTLPRIHVAILGIEKLVMNLSELDKMIQILARSATGQKITTYTSLISGSRKPEEYDGPQEMHVILIDNGRSDILAGESAEILGCIRCGACLNVCPVYKHIGGHAYGDTYPGPIGSVVTPGLRGVGDWKDLPSASTLCGACKDVCPVRLDIPRMLLHWRKMAVESVNDSPILRLGFWCFSFVATKPKLFRIANRFVAWFSKLFSHHGWIFSLPGLGSGWTRIRDFKAPAIKSFQDLWKLKKENSRKTYGQ